MKRSEVEEVLGLGSFEKGLKTELYARLREERNMVLALAAVFVVGAIIGYVAIKER